MKFLLKVNMAVEAANDLAKAGKLGATFQEILGELKPEAAYFTTNKGQRTAYIILEMKDTSEMPAVAEPFFLAFKAGVQFYPVMTPDDLMKAMPAIDRVVKKYR